MPPTPTDRAATLGRAALLAAGLLLLLAGCSGPAVTEDTATEVTVRYDGFINTLADATATAERLCARHGKTARVRKTANDKHYLAQRFLYADCVARR